jgi:hypothetical protein
VGRFLGGIFISGFILHQGQFGFGLMGCRGFGMLLISMGFLAVDLFGIGVNGRWRGGKAAGGDADRVSGTDYFFSDDLR